MTETTAVPTRLAYRLRINRPIPVEISATVGDVVHNLRAGLECLAFELAQRSHVETLSSGQQRASTFPICVTPEEFDRFIARKDDLYNQPAVRALRSAQPFAIAEDARQRGVDMPNPSRGEADFDELSQLNTIWNIDKHRRLALMNWWPDLYYWRSDGPSNRRMFPGDGTMKDGSILFYMEGIDGNYDTEVMHQFNLALVDDPGFRHGQRDDVVSVVGRWYRKISSWVLPKIFGMMSQ
ncbi:MAG TPA: hypothetical protein VFX16_28400 [Pseudonocardiaceae bacterium]|nr:hypothetical protein [Pseudonocardiaceae bacterium]